MTTLILSILILTSCSFADNRQFEDFLEVESKSVTASAYSMFISKFKTLMSEEALLEFQNIYFTKPAASTKTPKEVFSIATNNKGYALYQVGESEGGNRFRLTMIDFTDKVNSFKVYTLYEV